MDTWTLEDNLRKLDARTQSIGNEILRQRDMHAGYLEQAEEDERRSDELYTRACAEEDEERASQLRSQASYYRKQAARSEAAAAGIGAQLTAMEGELQELRGMYGFYLEEGRRNLVDLGAAASSLLSAGTSPYGGGASLQNALRETRRRMTYNDNLVKGCQARMAWIDQICGPSGDPYVKAYRRR